MLLLPDLQREALPQVSGRDTAGIERAHQF